MWIVRKNHKKGHNAFHNVNAMTDVIALMVTIWPGDTKVYYTLFSCSQIIIHVYVFGLFVYLNSLIIEEDFQRQREKFASD